MELKFRIYQFLMNSGRAWSVKELAHEIGMKPQALDPVLKKLSMQYQNIKLRQGIICEEYYWEGANEAA